MVAVHFAAVSTLTGQSRVVSATSYHSNTSSLRVELLKAVCDLIGRATQSGVSYSGSPDDSFHIQIPWRRCGAVWLELNINLWSIDSYFCISQGL